MQGSLDVLGDPVIPLEEGESIGLALLEEFVSLRLHLDQLLLFLVHHHLGQQRHIEKLVISIFPCRFDTAPVIFRVLGSA